MFKTSLESKHVEGIVRVLRGVTDGEKIKAILCGLSKCERVGLAVGFAGRDAQQQIEIWNKEYGSGESFWSVYQ